MSCCKMFSIVLRQKQKNTCLSLTPRYVLVKQGVNRTKILCGPPSGSLANTKRMSPNRSCKIAEGRAPAGASKRTNNTKSIRISPSLKDLLVVLIASLIWFVRSSTVMHRLTRLWSLKPCFLARSRSTYRISGFSLGLTRNRRTLCIFLFISASSLFPVALSKTRRKTFQYVPRELLFLMPRFRLPSLPTFWLRDQSKKLKIMDRAFGPWIVSRYLSASFAIKAQKL